MTSYVNDVTEEVAGGYLEEGEDTSIAINPLFHIMALGLFVAIGLNCGNTTVLMPVPQVDAILQAIQKYRTRWILGVPALYRMILENDRLDQYDLSSLKYCYCGGDVLPIEVFKRWKELLGLSIYQVYGSTEAGHVTYSRLDKEPELMSIGLPLRSRKCQVVDAGKRRFELHSYVRDHDDFVFTSEREALEGLARDIRDSKRIVTWNGRGFDMPQLSLRAMVIGVDWSFWPGMSHRYANYKRDLVHHDLMDLLGDQGGVRAMPMDSVARSLGLPGKHDVSGKDVGRLWAAGEHERIERYCREDVITTYLIYLRWCGCLEGTEAAHRVWNQVLAWARQEMGEPWSDLPADLTIGRRSRWTLSRETSGPPAWLLLPAILSISSRKTMPVSSTR